MGINKIGHIFERIKIFYQVVLKIFILKNHILVIYAIYIASLILQKQTA